MTNPIQDDAQLSNLSDDYIRNLEPESQRYDITLAQDFVISVLPNGIKTWAFIYDFQGRHRRKTLGVFPEMNFEDARAALEKARASMQRMDEPTVAPNEFGQLPAVLGGGKYIPKKERTPFNWLRVFKALGAIALLAALAGLAFFAFKQWEQFSAASPAAAEDTSAATEPSLPFTLDRKMTPQDATAEDSAPNPAPAGSRTATPNTAPAPAVRTSQSDTTANNAAPAATAPPTGTSPAPSARSSASTSNNSQNAAGAGSSRSGTAPPQAKPITELASTTKATAFGGRVARSRLTSRVQDLEPTDTLGPEISYKNSGFTRVFYFTELREFSDGTVVHRWSLDGVVHEEVVLKVSKSWRWRTYSNKDLTPGLNGQWKVETIDATGKILDTEEFTYDYR